jgi:hypothetical protein
LINRGFAVGFFDDRRPYSYLDPPERCLVAGMRLVDDTEASCASPDSRAAWNRSALDTPGKDDSAGQLKPALRRGRCVRTPVSMS